MSCKVCNGAKLCNGLPCPECQKTEVIGPDDLSAQFRNPRAAEYWVTILDALEHDQRTKIHLVCNSIQLIDRHTLIINGATFRLNRSILMLELIQ